MIAYEILTTDVLLLAPDQHLEIPSHGADNLVTEAAKSEVVPRQF